MCQRSGLLQELLQEALEARREEHESGGTSHKVCAVPRQAGLDPGPGVV